MAIVDFNSVKNYYESLVFQRVLEELGESRLAKLPGALEDVACLALNQLPGRYVRYTVDASFYMSAEERLEMDEAVSQAVRRAAEYVSNHPSTAVKGSD